MVGTRYVTSCVSVLGRTAGSSVAVERGPLATGDPDENGTEEATTALAEEEDLCKTTEVFAATTTPADSTADEDDDEDLDFLAAKAC